MKDPLDPTPYPKDPRSQPIDASIADGCYVYVQDGNGVVHVLPDGPHVHPVVLGGGLSAQYEFHDENGLRDVAAELRRHGLYG